MTKLAKLQQRQKSLEERRVELSKTMPNGKMRFGDLPGLSDDELAFWSVLSSPVDGKVLSFNELEIVTREPRWGGNWDAW